MFLKVVVTIFAALTIITAGYGMLYSTDEYINYMLFFMGITILALGIFEIEQAKKSFWGYLCSIVAIGVFIVWFQAVY